MKKRAYAVIAFATILMLILSTSAAFAGGGDNGNGNNGNGPPDHSNAGGNGKGRGNQPDVDHGTGGPDDSSADNNPSDSDAHNNDDTHSNGPNRPIAPGKAGDHANCDNNGFDCPPSPTPTPPPEPTPTPTPEPTPTPTPIPPPEVYVCSRQGHPLNLAEILELYGLSKFPGKDDWSADFPAGPEAIFHMGCWETVVLYYWTADEGWTRIGVLTTFGPGSEIVLDLEDLISHMGDNYLFILPGEETSFDPV